MKKMQKITNNSQPYGRFFFGLISLIIGEVCVTIFLISNLIRFEFEIPLIIIIIILVLFFYFIIRAIKNAFLYFVSEEECCCENEIFIYRRILFKKILLKEIKIPIMEIEEILDKGRGESIGSENYYNILYYIVNFNIPYLRIILKVKNEKRYEIFTDTYNISNKFLSLKYDDSDFLRNFNALKEMVEEEKNTITSRRSCIFNWLLKIKRI